MLEFLMMRGEVAIAGRVGRDRAAEGKGDADGADPRRGRRRARRRRRREGRVAGRPDLAQRRLRGTHSAAVAVRPARPRPGTSRGAVRLRVHARDVQAGGQAPLGLLRATDPPPRPAGREGGRDRRPRRLRAAGARGPRGRELHTRRYAGGPGRVGGPRGVARAGGGRARRYAASLTRSTTFPVFWPDST